MLHAQGLGKELWGEAVVTATYLKNRSPAKSLKDNRTPFEVWTGKKPFVGYLQVFRTMAYTFIPKEKRKKLDSKTMKTIFVGYAEDSKAYRLYDPLTKKIIRSRDVDFEKQQNGEVVKTTEKPTFTPLDDEIQPEVTIQESIQEEDTTYNNNPTQEPLRRSTRIKQPPKQYWIANPHQDMEANIAYLEEPQSFKEAMRQDVANE